MLLSDLSIEKYVKNGSIKIFPEFDMKDIRPTGIRLHLGDQILIPHEGQRVDFEEGNELLFDKVSLREKDRRFKFEMQQGFKKRLIK